MNKERFVVLETYGRSAKNNDWLSVVTFLWFSALIPPGLLFSVNIPQAGRIIALSACVLMACVAFRLTREEWRIGHVPMRGICLVASMSSGIAGGVSTYMLFGCGELLIWPIILSAFLSGTGADAFSRNDPAYERLLRITNYFVTVIMSALWGMAFSVNPHVCLPSLAFLLWFAIAPGQLFAFMSLVVAILIPSARRKTRKTDSEFAQDFERECCSLDDWP